MSSKKRKKAVQLVYDPTLTANGPQGGSNGEARPAPPHNGSRDAYRPLVFEERGNVYDIDEAERKKKLAIMLSMRERENAPWCENCNLRKCQRIGDRENDLYDEMCGVCSRETMIRPKAVRRHAGLTGREKTLRHCYKCGEKKKGLMMPNPEGVGSVWFCKDCGGEK